MIGRRRLGWLAGTAIAAIATVLAVLLLGTLKPESEQLASPSSVVAPSPTPSKMAALSGDRKSVVADGQVALAIDDDQIFEWFRSKSQLCHVGNITTAPDRRAFCENKASFRDQTRFVSIVVSPDGLKIGFTVESSALSPDRAAGIFLRSSGRVHFLSSLYYLDEQFIGFSPTGTNFVYRGSCFESKCGLVIFDSETLAKRASLNNPSPEERRQNATFMRWISDKEIEYRLDTEQPAATELRRESF